MATLCKAYPSEAAARRAVDGLRAEGLGAQLITGGRTHDLRREPAGEFGKWVAPNEPVRTFANTTVPRWRPGGGFAGHPDDQREGSFGDADRCLVVRADGRGHVAGSRTLAALLSDAGLDDGDVADAVSALHEGASIVLVQSGAVAV